ncbi:hypothetical protein ACFQVA_37375 [Actinomadura keratinilytica]
MRSATIHISWPFSARSRDALTDRASEERPTVAPSRARARSVVPYFSAAP